MKHKMRLGKQTKNEIAFTEDHLKMVIGVFVLIALMIPAQGYCDAAALKDVEDMTKTTIDTIFAPWLRKTLLGFGAGWGLFQSIAGGSFKPLLTWGGLGLVANYIPKLVEYLSKL